MRNPRMLSIDELCEQINISKNTIYSHVSANMIPHYKIGKRLRFKLDEVLNAYYVDSYQILNSSTTRDEDLGRSLKTEYAPQIFQNLEDPFS